MNAQALILSLSLSLALSAPAWAQDAAKVWEDTRKIQNQYCKPPSPVSGITLQCYICSGKVEGNAGEKYVSCEGPNVPAAIAVGGGIRLDNPIEDGPLKVKARNMRILQNRPELPEKDLAHRSWVCQVANIGADAINKNQDVNYTCFARCCQVTHRPSIRRLHHNQANRQMRLREEPAPSEWFEPIKPGN